MAPDPTSQLSPTESDGVADVLVAQTFGPRSFSETWVDLLQQHGLRCQVWDGPDSVASLDLDRITMACVFDPPKGLLAQCPNLRLIHSMGAGISPSMLNPEVCPRHVPLLRVRDDMMAQRMSTWCLWAVINIQRQCDAYLVAQQAASWQQGKAVENYAQVDNGDLSVGVMGAGNLGLATISLLQAAGYRVSAWTRTPRSLPGVRCYSGPDQLRDFASSLRLAINLVPLTPATRGILDARFFAWLPRGAALINVSRGQHVVTTDLLAALDSGHLACAYLDVFDEEPLPPDSPLWRHPRIRVFPHISGITHLPSAAQQMARCRAAVLGGEPLPPGTAVDVSRGY